MSKYTLKTYRNSKLVERFENRSVPKLFTILSHPNNHRAHDTGPFGEELNYANRFEIHDSHNEKIFIGNVEEAIAFSRTLR